MVRRRRLHATYVEEEEGTKTRTANPDVARPSETQAGPENVRTARTCRDRGSAERHTGTRSAARRGPRSGEDPADLHPGESEPGGRPTMPGTHRHDRGVGGRQTLAGHASARRIEDASVYQPPTVAQRDSGVAQGPTSADQREIRERERPAPLPSVSPYAIRAPDHAPLNAKPQTELAVRARRQRTACLRSTRPGTSILETLIGAHHADRQALVYGP